MAKYNIVRNVALDSFGIEYIISDEDYSSKFIVNDYEAYRLGIQDMEQYLIEKHEYTKTQEPDYRQPGPSNYELEMYPALAAAWREFKIIQRMCCGKG